MRTKDSVRFLLKLLDLDQMDRAVEWFEDETAKFLVGCRAILFEAPFAG